MSLGPPVAGIEVGARKQNGVVLPLFQPPLTETGNSSAVDVVGINGAQTIELIKAGDGTPTYEVQGTFDRRDQITDATVWEELRYLILGSGGSLVPVAGATAFLATDPQAVFLAVLDAFPTIRVVITGAGTYSITGRLYACPQ